MKCMMCPKTDKNCRFYDPSPYRPICSSECYSKFFDEWLARDSSSYAVMTEKRRTQNREAQRRWRKNNAEKSRKYQQEYGKKMRAAKAYAL